jgi:hypothetical protein
MNSRSPKLKDSVPAGAASRIVRPIKWFALLLLCGVFCFGTRGTVLNTHKLEAFAHETAAAHFAIADFDGDNLPDFATVETGLIGTSRARYWIGFRMSAGTQQMIGVNAPVGGLEIVSRDVNGDNVIDLVVSAAWLKSPVAVLVNDGHGNFSIRDPAAFSAELTNQSRTLDSPSREKPDNIAALSMRSSGDFVASDRLAPCIGNSEKLFPSSSLRKVLPLAVRTSDRAPPLS